VGRLSQACTEVEENARQHEGPIGKGVETRKRHVARANHQGDQIISKAGEDGRGIPEDHGHAMHGEKLIVGFRGKPGLIGTRQLNAHDQSLDSTDDEKNKSRRQVAMTDFLVIDGGEPTIHRLRSLPDFLQTLPNSRRAGAHESFSGPV